MIPNLFENSDVISLDLGSIKQFWKRQEIWIIYFYNPKNDESKKFENTYKELASKLYGIVKVASLDCLREEELCEEFGVFDHPSIMIYTEEPGDDGERYRGKEDLQSLATASTKKMQNFVSVVNSENYETSFLERDRATKNKILLFTDKKSTPAVFKALSKKYKDRLLFGSVRNTETELCKKFGVTEFPTILALTDPEGYKGEKYKDDVKVDQLSKFLGNYAYSLPPKKLDF